MPKRRTIVDFSEIFEHAIKHFNLTWNECNDLFYVGHEIMSSPERKNTEFYLDELEDDLHCLKEFIQVPKVKKQRVYEILIHFMNENKLQEMHVEND